MAEEKKKKKSNVTASSLNPYMGQDIYRINQNILGSRANSVYGNTLTNYGQNKGLQIEQILETTVTAAGTTTLDYEDQSKSEPPQILAFLTIEGTVSSTTLPYSEVVPLFGTVSYFFVTAFNTNVKCIVQGTPVFSSYKFTVYVLKQNILI